MFAKVKTWRSEKYLNFIRQQNCANCFKPCEVSGIEAHHVNGEKLGGGTGLKESDAFTIPLCRVCHNAVHANKGLIDQKRTALLMLEKAINEGILVIAK